MAKIIRAKSEIDPIDYYSKKTLDELKLILPKWACGIYENLMLDKSLQSINQEYSIYMVNTIDLIKNADFGEVEYETLFTEKSQNNNRISRILLHWENNGFIDPPTIGPSNSFKGRLSFFDGRHRTKLAYHLGHYQIPIATHNSDIYKVSKIVQLFPHMDSL